MPGRFKRMAFVRSFYGKDIIKIRRGSKVITISGLDIFAERGKVKIKTEIAINHEDIGYVTTYKRVTLGEYDIIDRGTLKNNGGYYVIFRDEYGYENVAIFIAGDFLRLRVENNTIVQVVDPRKYLIKKLRIKE